MILNTNILSTPNSTFKNLIQNLGLEFLILAWFFFVLLPYGPAFTFDSVSFLQAGGNFWQGNGYSHSGSYGLEFAAHRFPLYPLILGLIGFSKLGLFVLQFLIFGSTLFVFRCLLKLLNAQRYFLAFFFFTSMLLNYYSLWTEGLYGLLFILLLIGLKKEDHYRPVLWIGLLLGLLCFTKMVGLVCGGALLLAYCFQKRYLRGVLVCLISSVVISFWVMLGTNYLGETARPLMGHFISFQDIKAVFQTAGEGFLPAGVNPVLSIIIGVSLVFFPLFYLIKHWKIKASLSLLEWFLLIHFYAYIAFVLISKSLIDASIPIEVRTFFPLYLNLFVLLVLSIQAEGFSDKLKGQFNYLFPKSILILVVWNVFFLVEFRELGLGYNSADWQSFEFPKEIENLNTKVLYTNDQSAINYFTQFKLNPTLLAEKKNLYSLLKNDLYKEEYDGMIGSLSENKLARIVWVRNGITAAIYPTYEDLKNDPSLEIIYDDWLCLILKAK